VAIDTENEVSTRKAYREKRWPALIALFAIATLQLALPEDLSLGPGWLILALVVVLTAITVLARRRGNQPLNQAMAYASNGLVTLSLIWSLVLLIRSLPAHTLSPKQLLIVASVLWTSNVLVFASWYWRLDAGGPNARDLRHEHSEGAFLFPQMTLDKQHTPQSDRGWSPGFVDYLFLAFTASTALSPTDTPVLSRWAKMLMMVQASISLITVVLLAARAVNIL
jgi:hypothetical protein